MERSGLEGLISYAADTGEGSVELDFEVENINKADVSFGYTEEDSETGEIIEKTYETGITIYSEKWKLKLTDGTSIPDTITLKSDETVFYTVGEDGENLVAMNNINSTYQDVYINKAELKTLLGTIGTLKIYTNNIVIQEINMDNIDTLETITNIKQVEKINKKEQEIEIIVEDENGNPKQDENGNFITKKEIIEVEEKVIENVEEEEIILNLQYKTNENVNNNPSSISLVLNNIDKDALSEKGSIELSFVYNKNVSGIEEAYVLEDIIAKIESKLTIEAGNLNNKTYTEETYFLRTTKATIETDVDTLFYKHSNDFELTINLHTEEKKYELFNNPTFIVQIPNYLTMDENIAIEDIKIENNLQTFEINEASSEIKNIIDSLGKNAFAFSLTNLSEGRTIKLDRK